MASDTGTRDGEARMSRASAAGSQVFKIDAYIARLEARPAFQRAQDGEGRVGHEYD